MSTQSGGSRKSKKGGENMVMTGFRVLPADLDKAKKKAGLIPLSKHLRALFLMWLNGEIELSEDELKKYND